MKKLNIAFALGSYLPRTYTWVYNQLRFLKDTHVLILAGMVNPERIRLPLNAHELFSFPGLEVLKPPGFLYVFFADFCDSFWLILTLTC